MLNNEASSCVKVFTWHQITAAVSTVQADDPYEQAPGDSGTTASPSCTQASSLYFWPSRHTLDFNASWNPDILVIT